MKIAYFTASYLQTGGGFEKYLIESSNLLSKEKNIKVDIFTPSHNFNSFIIKLMGLIYLNKSLLFGKYDERKDLLEKINNSLENVSYINAKSFKDLTKNLSKYDVIYSKNEILEAFILKFLIGYNNIPPVIFGVHTPHVFNSSGLIAKLHNLIYESKVYTYLCNGVKGFHVLNNFSFEKIRSQFPKTKVYKINYSFDVSGFKNLSDKNFFQDFDNNKINIVWSARLSGQKGVEDLLELIMNINNLEIYKDRIMWHIAGGGSEVFIEELKKLENSFTNIRYYGQLDFNKIPSFLINANLFISTSKWEVNPYNIVEAQSMGLPVFAYNIPGPRDIIIPNYSGLLLNDCSEMISSIKKFIDGEYTFKDIDSYVLKNYNPTKVKNDLIDMFKNYAKY